MLIHLEKCCYIPAFYQFLLKRRIFELQRREGKQCQYGLGAYVVPISLFRFDPLGQCLLLAESLPYVTEHTNILPDVATQNSGVRVVQRYNDFLDRRFTYLHFHAFAAVALGDTSAYLRIVEHVVLGELSNRHPGLGLLGFVGHALSLRCSLVHDSVPQLLDFNSVFAAK